MDILVPMPIHTYPNNYFLRKIKIKTKETLYQEFNTKGHIFFFPMSNNNEELMIA